LIYYRPEALHIIEIHAQQMREATKMVASEIHLFSQRNKLIRANKTKIGCTNALQITGKLDIYSDRVPYAKEGERTPDS